VKSKSERVGKKVRDYIILYASLILFIVWGDDLIRLITASIGKQGDLEFAQKLSVSIITVLGALSVIAVDLGRDCACHLLLDSLIFKVRRRVNKIIVKHLIEKARLSGAKGWEAVTEIEADALNLFWHFVNKQGGVLSDRAHRLFEQYYTNIYALSLGCLGFIAATIVAVARGKLDAIAFTPSFFLLIVFSLAASTKWMLLKNIYRVPVQQIDEIALGDMKKEIERRFEEISNAFDKLSDAVIKEMEDRCRICPALKPTFKDTKDSSVA